MRHQTPTTLIARANAHVAAGTLDKATTDLIHDLAHAVEDAVNSAHTALATQETTADDLDITADELDVANRALNAALQVITTATAAADELIAAGTLTTDSTLYKALTADSEDES